MPNTDAKSSPQQQVVSCEFRLLNDNRCGRPAYWKWSHFRRATLIETHYCQEHGNGMRDEGRCAVDGSWSVIAAQPEMSEQEFDEIMERTNQACIAEYGKTFCELIEEGEAESAQRESPVVGSAIGSARRCVICGARVRNQNPKANTCSPDCTAMRDKKPAPDMPTKLCGSCQSPIDDSATTCESCGATDFDT